jgi:uncharacterized protein
MLLEMRFGNFLSYKDETYFYMTAAPIKEKKEDLNIRPLFSYREENILKTAAIFGANGSGKSNVLKAIQFFIDTILNKPEDFWQNFRNKYSNPFLLNSRTKKEATSLEMSFAIQDLEYRYGFEILENRIEKEWLFKKQERETRIFFREQQNFDINGEYKIFKQLEIMNMIREDALLLTSSAQFNEPTAREILNYFQKYYFFDSFEITSFIHGSKSVPRLEEPEFLEKVSNLLKKADTGIQNIKIRKDRKLTVPNTGNIEMEALLNLFTNKQSLLSFRNVYDENGNVESLQEFIFSKFESEGTRKFFDIAVISLEVLEKGGVLFIDELDTKFHPLLTQNLINLFYNPKINTKNAQLVFTTHDIALLEADLLRRDQIWLAEKDSYGASTLTPLNEFKSSDGKGIRNDEAISKNYLKGKYGAVPILSEF